MVVTQGREAVWQHAKEAGLQDDIKLIAKYFDIKDVSIIYGGKMTYIEERPRRSHRIAVVAKPPHPMEWYLKQARESGKR